MKLNHYKAPTVHKLKIGAVREKIKNSYSGKLQARGEAGGVELLKQQVILPLASKDKKGFFKIREDK